MRVLGRFRRMRHGLTSFFAGRNEEEACFETARSARGFSRNALAVLDDKLAFSATLMRAGEVDAAIRMMREAEAEVLHEETVLLERVQDVAAAGSTPRARMTRLRLARLLAITLLSASVMVFSVFGFALAGVIVERLAPAEAEAEDGGTRTVNAVGASDTDTSDKRFVHTVRVAGKEVRLRARHFRTYRAIANGDMVSAHQVNALLLGLPLGKVNALLAGLPPELANALRESVGMPPMAVDLLSQVKQTATEAKESAPEEEQQDSSTAEPSEESSSDSSTSNGADSEGSQDSDGGSGGGGGGRSSKGETELNLEDLLSP